ncbi:MAG: hypothetical protein ACRDRZ_11280 [Pseudonocardiaceae bacterium]
MPLRPHRRHADPTNDDRLILPTELASESRTVWRRHGRCTEVLAELLELPDPAGGTS